MNFQIIYHTFCVQTDNPIIVGDINIPWNKTDNLDTISLTEILELYNLKQHVATPTHKQCNTIDWVMSIKNSEEFLDLHTMSFCLTSVPLSGYTMSKDPTQ